MQSIYQKTKAIVTLIAVLVCSISFGQVARNAYTVNVISTTPTLTVVEVIVNDYDLQQVNTNLGMLTVPTLKGASQNLTKGAPSLPYITIPVEIAGQGTNSVYPTYGTMDEHVLQYPVAPSKGNLLRNVNPNDVPYAFTNAYNAPQQELTLGEPYIIRGTRGVAIRYCPFLYNAQTNELRVAKKATLILNTTGTGGVNTIATPRNNSNIEFEDILKGHFVNHVELNQAKANAVTELGEMLIITAPAFESALTPFVNWKNRKGIKTTVVTTNITGTTTSAIKNYISTYYGNHNLSYVLLVGDIAQIPSESRAGGVSDPYYGYMEGTDSYAEVIVGRFSAENITHVETMVNRTISYETTPPTGDTRFKHSTHISSNEGPGDDNEMDWEHQRLIRMHLDSFTYTSYNEYYDADHSVGGNDAPGDPTPANITQIVNAGTGHISYTGHGWMQGFGSSGFSNTEIAQLTNTTGIWPFIWSVACVNGEFQAGTCFGEAWLRAGTPQNPTGAIAALMSTINQSWSPPMEGQDDMTDNLRGASGDPGQRSFGAISVRGCMKMNDAYGQGGADMTDTWTCFGDPSVVVRTADPMTLTATHPVNVPLGTTQVTVSCGVEGALIALSQNNILLGKALVSGGVAVIDITGIALPDAVTVCATAFNHTPYIGTIQIAVNNGPFVVATGNSLEDGTPLNNNNLPDYAENLTLSVALQNAGNADAPNVSLKLRTTNPYVTITDSTHTLSLIQQQSIVPMQPMFAYTVANNVPNQTLATFTLEITSGSNVWSQPLTQMLLAPTLAINSVNLITPDNNNLEAGEFGSLTFNNVNAGSSIAANATATLTTTDGYVTISNPSVAIGNMAIAATPGATFGITAAANTPTNHWVTFNYTITAGAYTTTMPYMVKVNAIVDDFETGDYDSFEWSFSGDVPWVIDNTVTLDGVNSSRSGTITDSQTSSMLITVDVNNNDTIAFFKKTGCEQDWDFLRFYIDDVEQAAWSGATDWERVAYPVTAGEHTFRWTYAKDDVYSTDPDAVWVDYVELPAFKTNTSVVNTLAKPTMALLPNPANGPLTIALTAQSTKGTVKVINMLGQTLQNITVGANTTTVKTDVSALPNGVYTVVYTNGNTTQTQKLVVR